MDNDRFCRICRSGSGVLSRPCKCSGSMMWIHQNCLEQWLRYSRKDKCEVCGHKFHFTKVYADSRSKAAALPIVLRHLTRKLISKLSVVVVALFWTFLAPLACSGLWYAVFEFWTFIEALKDFSIQTFRASVQLVNSSLSHVCETAISQLLGIVYPLLSQEGGRWLREQLLFGYELIFCTAVVVLGLLVLREAVAMNTPRDVNGNPRLPTVEELAIENANRLGDFGKSERDSSVALHHLAQQGDFLDSNSVDKVPEFPPGYDFESRLRYMAPGTESMTTVAYVMRLPKAYYCIETVEDLFHALKSCEQGSLPQVSESASHALCRSEISPLSERSNLRAVPLLNAIESPADLFAALEMVNRRPLHVWMNVAAPIDQPELANRPEVDGDGAVAVEDDVDADDVAGVNFQDVYDILGINRPVSVLFQNLILLLLMVFLTLFVAVSLPMQVGRLFYKTLILLGLCAFISKELFFDRAADAAALAVVGFLNVSDPYSGAKTAPPNATALMRKYLDLRLTEEEHGALSSWLLGWLVLLCSASLYVPHSKIYTNPYVYTVFKLGLRCLKGASRLPKFIAFFLIELLLIPIGCCMSVLLLALPVMTDLDWRDVLRFVALGETRANMDDAKQSLTGFLVVRGVLWMLGAHMMYHLTNLVGFMRSKLRPGVLWFIRDPNDPNFDPMAEMTDKPVLAQMRKLGFGTLMYVSVGVFALGLFLGNGYTLTVVSWAVLYPFSGVYADSLRSALKIWPLQVRYHATLPALAYFPVDVSVGLLLYRAICKMFMHLPMVQALFMRMLTFGARLLQLEPFLFGTGWKELDATYRVPNTDDLRLPVPIQENVMIPMRSRDNVFGRMDQKPEQVAKLWTKVPVPQNYLLRSIVWVFAVLLGALAFLGGTLFFLLPLVTGRLLSKMCLGLADDYRTEVGANVTMASNGTNITIAPALYRKTVALEFFPAVRSDLPLHDVQSFLLGSFVLYGGFLLAKFVQEQRRRRVISVGFVLSAVLVWVVLPFSVGSLLCWSLVTPLARFFLSESEQEALFFLVTRLDLQTPLRESLFSSFSLALNNYSMGLALFAMLYYVTRGPDPLLPMLESLELARLLLSFTHTFAPLRAAFKLFFQLSFVIAAPRFVLSIVSDYQLIYIAEPDRTLQLFYPSLLTLSVAYALLKYSVSRGIATLGNTIDDALVVGQVLNDFSR